jgi:rubrerythrin
MIGVNHGQPTHGRRLIQENPMSPRRMTLPEAVRSKGELVAVAHALETEAAQRYRELAQRMRLSEEDELARLFVSLGDIEEKHAAHVDRRSLEMLGHGPVAAHVRWDLPENFDEEAARSARLTPHDALAIAVRNEERAFAFYAYVAADAEDAEIQDLAEEMAKDELDHAALLRRERRKAFRAQPPHGARQEPSQRPASLEELRTASARWSAGEGAALAALAGVLEAEGDPVLAAAFRQVANEELAAAGQAPGAKAVALNVRDGMRLLERAFDRYADLAEHAGDEAVVNEAQRLAERALRHLSLAAGTHGNMLIGAGQRPAH